jgi:chromosome segregation ATPase
VSKFVLEFFVSYDCRESEKAQFQEQISEKENQIRYCEEETKKQAEAIGILSSSNSFRKHKLNQLNEELQRFHEEKVEPLKDRYENLGDSFAIGRDMVSALEEDLTALTLAASDQGGVLILLTKTIAVKEDECLVQQKKLDDSNAYYSCLLEKIEVLKVKLEEASIRKNQVNVQYSDAERDLAEVEEHLGDLDNALKDTEARYGTQVSGYTEIRLSIKKDLTKAKEDLNTSEFKVK